jgi:DNA-binding beta-propeller fold protein YncE
MQLTSLGIIVIPGSTGLPFDHGAFDPKTRRVFVAHTACNTVEVIDHDYGRHLTTLHALFLIGAHI